MSALQQKREFWKKEQANLRSTLKKYDDFSFNIPSITNYQEKKGMLKYVGGVDISFYKNTDKAVACLIVLTYPALEKVSELYLPCVMMEPYMPGFLGFREVVHLKAVVNEFLVKCPEAKNEMIIMVDGNGILHYRGFGSASHLGVLLDIPTIGIGKELLVVDGMDKDAIMQECYDSLPRFGDCIDLIGPNSGRIYGRAMRTTSSEEPIYVSIGHKISLETAVELVKACCKKGTFLPEPVKLADGLSRNYISDAKAGKPHRQNQFFLPTKPQEQQKRSKWDVSPTHDTTSTDSTKEKGTIIQAQPTKKSKVSRSSKWMCNCGGENGVSADACTYCYRYNSKKNNNNVDRGSKVPGSYKEEINEIFSTPKRWNCPCGATVIGAIMCEFCRHVNM